MEDDLPYIKTSENQLKCLHLVRVIASHEIGRKNNILIYLFRSFRGTKINILFQQQIGIFVTTIVRI